MIENTDSEVEVVIFKLGAEENYKDSSIESIERIKWWRQEINLKNC